MLKKLLRISESSTSCKHLLAFSTAKKLEVKEAKETKEGKEPATSPRIKAGNLYTWGTNLGSLGYHTDKIADPILTPHKVETFNNNVVKVAMGPDHSAVVTAEGDLYTFGKGTFGALGHGEKKFTYTKPKLVQFFKKHNLKVVDAACGERFTLAVTDDGDVWSWGSGRRSDSFLGQLLPSDSNPLGLGSNHMITSPAPVESLRKTPPTISVIAGNKFCAALNVRKNLFYWGKGDYGVFGEGYLKGEKIPKLHTFFKEMQKHNGMKIKKIKACGNYAMALFNNGTLWAWGENVAGQLGIEDNYHEEFESICKIPAQISQKAFGGHRVKDFDVGEEISVILTAQHQVFWAGSKLSPKPTLLGIPKDKKIVKVGAASNSIAAVSDDGIIYMKDHFLISKWEDPKTGVAIADFPEFSKGKIIDIGGSYDNKYVIIHESEKPTHF